MRLSDEMLDHSQGRCDITHPFGHVALNQRLQLLVDDGGFPFELLQCPALVVSHCTMERRDDSLDFATMPIQFRVDAPRLIDHDEGVYDVNEEGELMILHLRRGEALEGRKVGIGSQTYGDVFQNLFGMATNVPTNFREPVHAELAHILKAARHARTRKLSDGVRYALSGFVRFGQP